jgi:hypothetical protein
MVSQQSTTIPLDYTHLVPKFKYGNRRSCFVHSVEDDESITDDLSMDSEFSKFFFILQLSGYAEKYKRMNGFTLAVVPNKFLNCVQNLDKSDAMNIILKHTINNAIRLFDIHDDLIWMQNGLSEMFTLSSSYWNDAKIMGDKQCSNGYIYIVDRIIV